MPNWIYITLTVKKGDPLQVWGAIRGRRDGDHGTPFTFNRLVPMPADIRNCGEIGTKSDLADKIIGSKPHFLKDGDYFIVEKHRRECEKRRYDYREVFELGVRRKKNLVKYGHADCLSWSTANWGTKWDACDAELSPNPEHEGKVLWFRTAWAPPEPIMAKLFAVFSDHELKYLTDSVENDWWTKDIVRGGKIVEHEEGCYDCDGIQPYEPFSLADLKRNPAAEIEPEASADRRSPVGKSLTSCLEAGMPIDNVESPTREEKQ